MDFDLSIYNAAQKESITTTEGPLLVISGAGTGKTHVLAGRVLFLLLEKKVSPDSILALTFTEKAAEEMVQRIDTALPLGYSGELFIKTFHALADMILRERGFEIGLPAGYALLSNIDAWLFLKRHITELPLDYYRPLSNPHKFLSSLYGHFSRLKDEDITPQQYLAYAVRLRDCAKTVEEKEIACKTSELAAIYERYESLMLKNGYMDFSSLLYYTNRLFEKRPSVLAEYQARFRYILVDEFQDTNYSQNKIVTVLAGRHRNLFVVGDDDQSIYKWRGASLTNIQYFQKLFPEAKRVVLNENYRSNQAILDMSYHAIQKNNPNRLEIQHGIDKRLRAATVKKYRLPILRHFPAFEEEIDFVVTTARELLTRNANSAILVRSNLFAQHFIEALRRDNLPFQHFSSYELFSKPLVKDLMAMLRVIADPWDDLALFKFLSNNYWNIPMGEILKSLRIAKRTTTSLFAHLENKPFAHILKMIKELIEYSRAHTVSQVLGKFLNDSGYLKALAEKHSRGLEEIAAFSQCVADFEKNNREKSVVDFLAYAQLLEEAGIPRSEMPQLDPNAIKVLTVHAAKGLEFDAVFIPGLVQWKFPVASRREPFDIPAELIPETLPKNDHHIEEERRLFYVACTRSRDILMLSYSDFYDGKKQWKPSVFVNEVCESGKVQSVVLQKKATASATASRQKIQSELPLEPRKHRTIKLAIPKLSFSQLDAFRTCPFKYQFRYLFQVPVPAPAVLNFGSSIHNTLRDFYSELQKNPKLGRAEARLSNECAQRAQQLGNRNLLPLLRKHYEQNWISYGYESAALAIDQKKRGFAMLERFYEHEKKSLTIPSFIEKQFTLKAGPVVLTGRIDRIDKREDGTYEVIDYKTGENHNKDLSADLQLSIYALACRDVFKLPVSHLSLYFLDKPEKISTQRTDAQLEECKAQIIECAKEMSTSDFTPTPGYHCKWCDYRTICPAAMRVVA